MNAGEYYAAQLAVLDDLDAAVDDWLSAMDMIAPGTSIIIGDFMRKTIRSAFVDMIAQLTSPLLMCGAATELDYYEGTTMGWAVGYDRNWKRDIGYGVPAKCDHPDCDSDIDRGLAYVCGGEPYGGEHGCGLYFCSDHLTFVETSDGGVPQVCERCVQRHERPDADEPELFDAKPDVAQWINWKLTDESWAPWRAEYPEEVEKMRAAVAQ